MPTLGLNTVPAERASGCTFAEKFRSSSFIAENGGTLNGSPVLSLDGIVLNGSTQSVSYSLTGSEFNSDGITIIAEFIPDFEVDADANHTLFDTTASNGYSVKKLNNSVSNVLNITLGDILVASIAEASYDAYWVVGEENQIVISGTYGDTSVWLNGTLILDADETLWVPKSGAVVLYVGSSAAGADFFDGTISSIKVFNSVLTDEEILDILNGTTFSYIDDIILDLPCDTARNNLALRLIKDISPSRNHASMGDGVNENTFPVKYEDQRGYNFSGVNYIRGINYPTGDFTIVLCKRITDTVTVSFENATRALDDLQSPGQFEGDLLSIRIFPRILTPMQQYNEEYILLDRVNLDGKPSGCIQKLIAAGDCVLFHDYRSGSFNDLSLYGNAGVPNPVTIWADDSLDFSVEGAEVYLEEKDEFLISEGSIIVLADFDNTASTEYLVSKAVNTDRAPVFYLSSTGTKLSFFDGTNIRTYDHIVLGDKCLAVNFQSTKKSEAFANGQYLGQFSDTSTIVLESTDMTIGCGTNGNKIKAVLFFNRKLTKEEHKRIYEELNKNVFASDVFGKETINFSDYVSINDQSLLASYNEISGDGKVKNLKDETTYEIDVIGQVHRQGFFKSMFNNTPGKSLNSGITSSILNPKKDKHTVSCWFKLNSLPASASQYVCIAGKGLGGLAFTKPYCGGIYIESATVGSFISYYHYDTVSASLKNIRTTFAVIPSIWYHVVYTVDQVANLATLYVNGEVIGTTAIGTMYTHATLEADGFRFFGINGSGAASADAPDTDMCFMQVHNEAKSANWVSNQYAIGSGALSKTANGSQESIALEVDLLTNSEFQNAYEFKLVSDTIENLNCKVIECTEDGNAIYLQSKYLE